jgi:hypothetical protein
MRRRASLATTSAKKGLMDLAIPGRNANERTEEEYDDARDLTG